MSTQLTIDLDNDLLQQVNSYAEAKQVSVSDIVKMQLMLLFPSEKRIHPVSSKLRGTVHLPKGFDYKQELEKRSDQAALRFFDKETQEVEEALTEEFVLNELLI